MLENRLLLALVLTSAITSMQGSNSLSKDKRRDAIAGILPANFVIKKPATPPKKADQLFSLPALASSVIEHQKQIAPADIQELKLTIQHASIDHAKSENDRPVKTELEIYHKPSREDLLTARRNSASQILPPIDSLQQQQEVLATEINDEDITQFIQASNIAALEEHSELVAHIPATITGRYKDSGPTTIDHFPYFGAIIIAIQNQAIEALSYLVSKAGNLNIPLEAESGEGSLGHYAVQAMARDPFLSENKEIAQAMLEILHKQGCCNLDALDGNGESMIHIAASLPYSGPVVSYLVRHTPNPVLIETALDLALKCSASDASVEEIMKQPVCAYAAFMHIALNQHRYQHVDSIKSRNPHILDEICQISLSSEYSLPLSVAEQGDWLVIHYLLTKEHLTTNALLTLDENSNIFLSAYNKYVGIQYAKTYGPKDFIQQERRAAFMRKCLELMPIEEWMAKSEQHHLVAIRQAIVTIDQISAQHPNEAANAIRYVNQVI